MQTHAEQEQQLLTYFEKYRKILNLLQFAEAAGVGIASLKFFLSGERGLSPEVLAKCLAYLRQQAQDLHIFLS